MVSTIDNLNYSYFGNKLVGTDDASTTPATTWVTFTDSNNGSKYTFNSSGPNLVQNQNINFVVMASVNKKIDSGSICDQLIHVFLEMGEGAKLFPGHSYIKSEKDTACGNSNKLYPIVKIHYDKTNETTNTIEFRFWNIKTGKASSETFSK